MRNSEGANVRAVVQRVRDASVSVAGQTVGSIDTGLMVLVGVGHGDTVQDAEAMASKLASMRVFGDEDDKMNLSVSDIGGSLLVVSQFTLAADLRKGRRPSFTSAAAPDIAVLIVDALVRHLRDAGLTVETGEFGARMEVTLTNDGPVTFVVDVSATR